MPKEQSSLSPEARAFFVEQGRKGGKMGAEARLKKVSAKRRKQIATEAAKARWSKKEKPKK